MYRLKHPMTVAELFSVLGRTEGKNGLVLWDGTDERIGYLQSIEREDGSGLSFNLRIRLDGCGVKLASVYHRCS